MRLVGLLALVVAVSSAGCSSGQQAAEPEPVAVPTGEDEASPPSGDSRVCESGDVSLRLSEAADAEDVALAMVFLVKEPPCVIDAPVLELVDEAGALTSLADAGSDVPMRLEGLKPDAVELTIIDAISTCEATQAHAVAVRLSSEAGVLAEIDSVPAVSFCATRFGVGRSPRFSSEFVVEGPLVRSGVAENDGGEGGGGAMDGGEFALTGGCLTVNGMPTILPSYARWNAESEELHLRAGRVLPVGTEVSAGVFVSAMDDVESILPESALRLWQSCGLPLEDVLLVSPGL